MDSNYQAHLSESDVDDIVNQILAEETQLFEERTSMFKAVTDDAIKRANARKPDVEHAVKAAEASKLDTKRAEATAVDTTPPIDTNPVQAKPVRTVASDVIHDADPTSTFTDADAFSPVDATGNIVVPMFLQEQVEAAAANSVEVKSIGAGGDINDDAAGHPTVTMQYDLINNEPITEATAQALEAIAPEAEVESDDTSGRMLNTDQIIGTNHAEAIELFADDPDTDAIVLIGEIGGASEELCAQKIKEIGLKKPVFAYIAGMYAPEGKRMGHAGAIVSGGMGTVKSKVAALKDAGVTVCPTLGIIVEEIAALNERTNGRLQSLEPRVD